jgi:hypothetical protein
MKRFRIVIFTLLLVLLTTACKFFFGPVPGWSGFSPVLAIALFSGFIVRQRDLSFFLPLVALFLSDLMIQWLHASGRFDYPGFYAGQWKNYLLLLTSTMLGWWINGSSYVRLLAGALAAPTVFYLASNYLVWAASTETFYAKNAGGLITCYEAGLPFYRNSVLATLVFLPLVILLYHAITRKRAQVRMA